MSTAAELRAEVERLRAFALSVTDSDVLQGIQEMVEELERRARALEDGDVGDT